MHTKRPRSQNFSKGHAPGPPSNLRFQRLQVASVALIFPSMPTLELLFLIIMCLNHEWAR